MWRLLMQKLTAAGLLHQICGIVFSRVHATLQPAPSVGRSVRNTLLFCVVFGHFGSSGVILSHFFVVFGHFWLVSVIFGHFWSFLINYVTLFIKVICVIFGHLK